MMDEAYAEFCDVSAVDLVGKHDNLVVARTFSKWYGEPAPRCHCGHGGPIPGPPRRAGLAGLRLGYCLAHEDLVATMMAIKQPYNVNTAAEAAGIAAIRHRDAIMATVTQLRQEKDRMYNALCEVCCRWSWKKCLI